MMTSEAREMRNAYMRDYMRKYRKDNREKISIQRKVWRAANPDKVKQYNETYWNKRAAEAVGGDSA